MVSTLLANSAQTPSKAPSRTGCIYLYVKLPSFPIIERNNIKVRRVTSFFPICSISVLLNQPRFCLLKTVNSVTTQGLSYFQMMLLGNVVIRTYLPLTSGLISALKWCWTNLTSISIGNSPNTEYMHNFLGLKKFESSIPVSSNTLHMLLSFLSLIFYPGALYPKSLYCTFIAVSKSRTFLTHNTTTLHCLFSGPTYYTAYS